MGAFTHEQAGLLAPLLEAVIAGLMKTNVRIAAIQRVLVQKGVIASEEFRTILKEAEAGMAVEKALRPDLDAMADKLKRLLEGAE